MDKCTLRRRISAVDFALWELQLFLDTHPHCAEALQKRAQLQAERHQLVSLYETNFGPLVLTSHDVKGDCWSWIDDPWPWDLEGGCC